MQYALSSRIIMLLVLFIFAAFKVSLSLNTLRQGDSLNSTSRLVSAGHIFTLGIDKLDINNNNGYVAIWRNIQQKPVWVGNRDNPSSNISIASLTISRTGSLFITTGEEDIFPLFQSSEARQNVSATLYDNGNFVLKEASSSGEDFILWQSFDYPTDTLLPGMKLGVVDRKTGRRRRLTSWSSYWNPASGVFTLEWEIFMHRLIIRSHGVFYWTSGELIDYYNNDYNLRVKRFDNIRAPDPLKFNYNFTNIWSNDEDCFMYTLIQVTTDTPYRMIPQGWILDTMGYLSEFYSDGSVTMISLLCDGSGVILGCQCNDQLQPFTGYGYFSLPNGEILSPVPDDNSDIDFHDCMESCRGDCDCAGFSYYPSCQYWIGRNLKFEATLSDNDYKFIRGFGSSNNSTPGSPSNSTPGSPSNSTPGYPINSTQGSPSNSTPGSSSNSKLQVSISESPFQLILFPNDDVSSFTTYVLNSVEINCSKCSMTGNRMLMWIIIVVVTSIPLLLAFAALVLMRRSKQRKREAEMNELLTLTEMYDHENGRSRGHDLRPFTYATLIAATSNFSSEYKLGEGGFGPVYKGQTTEGEEIAVKVLSRSSGQGLLEFKNEITLISKLQHVNLVKLMGFCIHAEDKLIVYDYMPNKSLDFFLFDPTKKEQLDWDRRFNIIDGISQGLLYLHKYSRLNIVHRDLKSGNILLDENLNPKISDFGLARIFKQNADEANTNRRVGTYGYMAPEYAMQGIFSFKSDVYSFGVLLLEIVSGRRNSSFQNDEGPLNLVEYAWELWSKDSTLELMDPTLSDSCNIEQLQRCVIIGLLCVENHASDRPNIEGVISMLKNEILPLPIPQNPAFITRNRVLEELGKSTSGKLSANEISISEPGGR